MIALRWKAHGHCVVNELVCLERWHLKSGGNTGIETRQMNMRSRWNWRSTRLAHRSQLGDDRHTKGTFNLAGDN
jgi:hypothetical protein